MTFLPQNPGPFATLQEWLAWRNELRTLRVEDPGVDIELTIADGFIAELATEERAAVGS